MKYYIKYNEDGTGIKVLSPTDEIPELLLNGYVEVTQEVFDSVTFYDPNEVHPDPEPSGDDAIWAALDAAYQEGVDSV